MSVLFSLPILSVCRFGCCLSFLFVIFIKCLCCCVFADYELTHSYDLYENFFFIFLHLLLRLKVERNKLKIIIIRQEHKRQQLQKPKKKQKKSCPIFLLFLCVPHILTLERTHTVWLYLLMTFIFCFLFASEKNFYLNFHNICKKTRFPKKLF